MAVTHPGISLDYCATFLPLGFPVFGSFSKELCALFDRFTTIIFEREQDSFCRSLCSIRKYYLKSWYIVILLYIYYYFLDLLVNSYAPNISGSTCSTMCLSMSAACVTKARLVNSRSYSDHDVNYNARRLLMVSCVYLCVYISNLNNTIIIIIFMKKISSSKFMT
jgi:hypothetical protein